MPQQICKLFKITGHVQGVWFRASTKDQANILGIKGWAKNMPDGSVEVMACGDPEKIQLLHEWLKKGPQLARVDAVDCIDVELQNFSEFTVK